MKIAFLGTPEFSKIVLDSLHNSKHQVVCVVTNLDKESGRGHKIVYSPVKQYALDNNIPVLQLLQLFLAIKHQKSAIKCTFFPKKPSFQPFSRKKHPPKLRFAAFDSPRRQRCFCRDNFYFFAAGALSAALAAGFAAGALSAASAFAGATAAGAASSATSLTSERLLRL